MKKIFIFMLLLLSTANIASAGWLSGYNKRYNLSVESDYIGTTMSNFPVAVVFDSSNFSYNHTTDNGFDIKFTADDGTTIYSHYLVQHNTTLQQSAFYVKIPSATSGTDTLFKCYSKSSNVLKTELFIDDTDLGTISGLSQSINRPARYGGLTALTGAVADDGGSQTTETTEINSSDANDVTLLPAIPTVGDKYWFCADEPFRRLRIDIGTTGVWSGSLTWKYVTSSGLTAAASVCDKTNNFKAATGVKDVSWMLENDWVVTTVNGITDKYCIVADVTVYSSITTQPLADQAWTDKHPLMGSGCDTWDIGKNQIDVDCTNGKAWMSAVSDGVSYSYHIAYATTSDCITFSRPNIGTWTWGGSTANNLITTEDPISPAVVIDSTLPSNRQYVMVTQTDENYNIGCFLWYSSDGINWNYQKQICHEDAIYKECNELFIKSDGRYGATYTRGHVSNLRSIGYCESDVPDPDGPWTNQGLVMSINAISTTSQRHHATIKQYNGYYFTMVGMLNNISGYSWGGLWFGRDIDELSMIDSNFLTVGEANDWDDAMVWPNRNGFEEVGNNWRFYVSGCEALHGSDPNAPFHLGMFTIEKERIGQISGTGSVITDAFTPDGPVYLNVDATGGGKIEVEVLDATDNSVIQYYEQTSCTDVTVDSYTHQVYWGLRTNLPNQQIKLKFYLTSATLYAYTVGAQESLTDPSTHGTFDSNYVAIYSLEDVNTYTLSPTGVPDSTSYNNFGIKKAVGQPAVTDGSIASAQDFDGTDDYVEIADDSSISSITTFTVEFMLRVPDITGTHMIISKSNNVTASPKREFEIYLFGQQVRGLKYDEDTNGYRGRYTNNVLTSDGWNYFAVTYDNSAVSSGVKIYKNISQVDTTNLQTGTFTTVRNTTEPMRLGTNKNTSGVLANFMNGDIDEMFVSNIERPSEHVKAMNYNLKGTLFNYLGSESRTTIPVFLYYYNLRR